MASIIEIMPALFSHIGQYVELSEDERNLLASFFRVKRLPKRSWLLTEGDVCQYESFVVEGCLRMFHTDEKGTEHTLHFAVEGWWITDLESFLGKTPSLYHIEAIENSILLQIDSSSLEHLYQKIPSLERYFRILHQNSFIAQSQRILQNISRSGNEKYTSFLEMYPQWHQRIPQKHIASYLGITPVFLSQLRKERAKK